MFSFDKTHFNYHNAHELMLNYDLGNLNSDIRTTNGETIWDISPINGNNLTINHDTGVSINNITNSSYRIFDGNINQTYYLTTANSSNGFYLDPSKGFAFNMRVNVSGNPSKNQILFSNDNSVGMELAILQTGALSFKIDDGGNPTLTVTIPNFTTNYGLWTTIFFGYNKRTGDAFLGIANQNLPQPIIATSNGTLNLGIGQQLYGKFLQLDGVTAYLGTIQYWVGDDTASSDKLNIIHKLIENGIYFSPKFWILKDLITLLNL